MSALSRAHTVEDFYPCRDATEELQICQHCGEDQRDHLGYEDDEDPRLSPVEVPGPEPVELFTFSPDPVSDNRRWRDIP